MSTPQRKILVTGATGKQGGAVIKALEANGNAFHILAMTRNANSASAKALAAKPNVTVVTGESSKPNSIFEANKPIYGVFSVTVPMGKISEEDQAKGLIDAAIDNGVEHFVFTSVERETDGKGGIKPTDIPHFKSKHVIEEYMKQQIAAKNSKMQWTILRPVAFMENLTPDFMGKGFASMWGGIGQKPLQLIATEDIGLFAAKAFNNPAQYQGRAIALAGDELNLKDAKKVFKETLGYEMPETFGFVGSGIKFAVKEMGMMFDWFKTDGYKVDIQQLRKEEPELKDFKNWLKTSSGFKPKA